MVVDAIDGSVNLCKLASEYTGIKVRNILFQELDEQEKYDGIWACASILHLSKKELSVVLDKMIAALKKNGIIYTSLSTVILKAKEMDGILQILQTKVLKNSLKM